MDALVDPAPAKTIPSWDQVAGDDGRHRADFHWEASAEAAEELMQQFAALGYIEDPAADKTKRGETAALENQFNLSQVYLSTNQLDNAIGVMEELVQKRPWESRFLHQLINSYLKAGYYQAANDLLEAAYPAGADVKASVLVWLLKARARLAMGHDAQAAPRCNSRCRRCSISVAMGRSRVAFVRDEGDDEGEAVL